MTENDGDVRLLGLKEIAALLGTDWRNVRGWVESGELPCLRVGTAQEPKLSLRMLREWQRRRAELAAEDGNQVAIRGSNLARPTTPKGTHKTPTAPMAIGRRALSR